MSPSSVRNARAVRAWLVAACAVSGACSSSQRTADELGTPAARVADTAARDTTTVVRAPGAEAPRDSAPSIRRGFAFSTDVGVLQSAGDSGLCLTIRRADLAPGDTLLVVDAPVADSVQRIGVVIVEGRRANPCTEPADERGSVQMDGASFYRLRLVRGPAADPGIAVRSSARLRVERNGVTGDLDGDGHPERFTACTSNEGVHLRVVTPVGGRVTERWHEYYYVPYDLEPTCPGA